VGRLGHIVNKGDLNRTDLMLLTPSRNRRTAAPLAAAVLFAACASSTSLVNMWRDPSFQRQPLNNVLVVTVQRNASSRRVWEDRFVRELKSHGVTATASYQEFPAGPPDTTALGASVRSRGYDAVLVAHQLPGSVETRYVPGYISTQPVTYMSPWTGHYYTYFADVYSPGYVENDRVVRYETEVWMTRGQGRLIWSGTTESINPISAAAVNKEIANVIVPAIIKAGVIQAN
jgi:hypothetical protein